MILVKVRAYQAVLVYRNGRLITVLTEGKRWIRPWTTIERYDTGKPFPVPANFNALLENEKFRAMIDVIEVADNQIVIQERDGNYEGILTPGRYAYWKNGLHTYKRTVCDTSELEVPASVPKQLIMTGKLTPYAVRVGIEAYERGLLYVEGTFVKTLQPGAYYFWKNEKLINVMKSDLRTQQLEISGQEILTRDKAAIRVNFQAQYNIADVVKAVVDAKDSPKQLYIMLQLALRAYAGALTLDEILARKEDVEPAILSEVSDKASGIGIHLTACGIRDIILPGDVKDIMNQVLIAEKKAQANVIMRREETASTRSLLNTAKLMEDNAMLCKLKEMEYVEKIAENIQSITLSGGSQIVDQLRQIFLAPKHE